MELFWSSATMFFLVMDPLGNTPLFISALRGTPPERRQFVILRECVIALGIMVAFLFLGKGLLELLHVGEPALRTAGGVILLLIAIRMIFPPGDDAPDRLPPEEPFIVPLAVPLLAGPSLLAVEVVIASNDFSKWPVYLGALVAAWAASTLILYFSGFLARVLGPRFMSALERLMGMILVILAVQLTLDGVGEFIVGLRP